MYEEDKNTEIYKRKAATTALNALQQLFLTAFMWRRPLNNAFSTTTIHGEPKKMPDGTYTRVGA